MNKSVRRPIIRYASALYDRLYADWRQVARRTHADGGLVRTEVLWLSAGCPATGLFDEHYLAMLHVGQGERT